MAGISSPPSALLSEGGDGELAMLMQEAGGDEPINFDDLNSRSLDTGEKADDAVDYEDIGDDDLADEEHDMTEAGGAVQAPDGQQAETDGFLDGIFDEAAGDGDNFDISMDDDLFGDDGDDEGQETAIALDEAPAPLQPELAIPETIEKPATSQDLFAGDEDDDLIAEDSPAHGQGLDRLEELDMDEEQAKEYLLQQALFAQSGLQVDVPENEADNDAELLKLLAPKFRPNEVPKWHEIFPPRRMNFDNKFPGKPPKPLRPTKITLEIEPDQKALFNSGISQNKRIVDGENGIISTVSFSREDEDNQEDDDLGLDWDVDAPLPGGITEQDLQILCADWDTLSNSNSSDSDFKLLEDTHDSMDLDYQRPAKKRKVGRDPSEIVSALLYDTPSFDDPELATARLSTKVVLDLNDPALLLEKVQPQQMVRAQTTNVKERTKSIKEKLAARFNHSNDAEYDMLKQNHQNKIRSTLGNLQVDHSAPALRLQYPYYKVKMPTEEARGFHRRQATFKPILPVVLGKPGKHKRKHFKGKKVKEIYASTKDLTMADNSTTLLLESSEEYPMMMSQVGMGSKIINYYRRRNKEDSHRPKAEVGESAVLLPEDKSPFYIFGHIDPGETTLAVYNSMYRAPIFEHQPKQNDFLLVRNTTGMNGQEWFLRKADHLAVVGQQLPSVDVPGPHSRKVTTASKNRLKIISFRIIRRKKSHRIRVEDVTKHFPDTTDMQNRQKMKEFLQFNRDQKEWEMKDSEQVPDEEALQSYVRPEDVCLLESMQVGQQYLHDAGIQDDNDSDDEAKEGANLEQQLAPWHTSRTFINATQGKAMLQLHGEGDPSGRGEAFSFIKTSMKGGFKALGESVTDKIAHMKELGGHSYNVARQQKAYEESIRRIWDSQKASLSSNLDQSPEADMEDAQEEAASSFNKPTPRSEAPTPAPWDETRSQITSVSNVSQTGNSVLRIRRTVKRNGQVEEVEEIIKDPAVIRQYKRRKMQEESAKIALADIIPTGDAELDARQQKRYVAYFLSYSPFPHVRSLC